MTPLSPDAQEAVRAADMTISERLDHIERVLKFDPHVPYRRQLIREYIELTTDPNEAKNG